MKEKQLEFWDILPLDEEQVRSSLSETREQVGNLRRGLFARYDALEKKVEKLEGEIRFLKGKASDQELAFWD